MQLDHLLRRREPLLHIVSAEESRVEAAVQRWCEQQRPPRPLFVWSATRGLARLDSGVLKPVQPRTDAEAAAHSILQPVLDYASRECEDEGVFLLKDPHPWIRASGLTSAPQNAYAVRALRDAFYDLRASGKATKIILLAPELVVPVDLEKEVRIHEFPLPTLEELRALAVQKVRLAEAISRRHPDFRYDVPNLDALTLELANAALGLTQVEVEHVLENLLYVDRELTDNTPDLVIREKQQIIRRSGVLEFIPPEDLQGLELGGLEATLQWLRLRRHVLGNRERACEQYGIKEVPRGVLLAGITGCGKSLVCKCIASEWGYPLLRLDVGAIFDRFVGASEERIRRALQVAESVAPCILWVDEIEKGFSIGIGGDGGTSARVLGTFLVWMQEKRAPVFIAATANDITVLPPELLRPGRFDNRFFVGCPGERSRREILAIHLRARKLDPADFDVEGIVKQTHGFTGAEIEQAVLDSAYDAFYEDRSATTEDLMRNLGRTRPVVWSLGPQMGRTLELLRHGRMELASSDTVPLEELLTLSPRP